MVIFHSYVSLPEGTYIGHRPCSIATLEPQMLNSVIFCISSLKKLLRLGGLDQNLGTEILPHAIMTRWLLGTDRILGRQSALRVLGECHDAINPTNHGCFKMGKKMDQIPLLGLYPSLYTTNWGSFAIGFITLVTSIDHTTWFTRIHLVHQVC